MLAAFFKQLEKLRIAQIKLIWHPRLFSNNKNNIKTIKIQHYYARSEQALGFRL